MATLPQGILGSPIGKLGPVTGYIRNGRNVLRTSRNNGTPVTTPARVAQREKIRICNEFTRAFSGTGFFNTTFPAYGHTGNGYNRATSCMMNLALTGQYPNQKLMWEKVMIARGPLPTAEEALATSLSAGEIQFYWADNSDQGTARFDDVAILVVYSPSLKKAVFTLNSGERHDREAVLNAAPLTGQIVATWMSFLNRTGDVADSVFCGMVGL